MGREKRLKVRMKESSPVVKCKQCIDNFEMMGEKRHKRRENVFKPRLFDGESMQVMHDDDKCIY